MTDKMTIGQTQEQSDADKNETMILGDGKQWNASD
jgi:hypothetical protein